MEVSASHTPRIERGCSVEQIHLEPGAVRRRFAAQVVSLRQPPGHIGVKGSPTWVAPVDRRQLRTVSGTNKMPLPRSLMSGLLLS